MEKSLWGLTVEGIQRGHGHLSMAQIYAALSYYYEHQNEVDAEIVVSAYPGVGALTSTAADRASPSQ
ncbi:MAG: hypothetical protein GY759_05470 [Chloroflexi bacterium]|nr:hypothetical protein [Chloroflexota bacterium]